MMVINEKYLEKWSEKGKKAEPVGRPNSVLASVTSMKMVSLHHSVSLQPVT